MISGGLRAPEARSTIHSRCHDAVITADLQDAFGSQTFLDLPVPSNAIRIGIDSELAAWADWRVVPSDPDASRPTPSATAATLRRGAGTNRTPGSPPPARCH